MKALTRLPSITQNNGRKTETPMNGTAKTMRGMYPFRAFGMKDENR